MDPPDPDEYQLEAMRLLLVSKLGSLMTRLRSHPDISLPSLRDAMANTTLKPLAHQPALSALHARFAREFHPLDWRCLEQQLWVPIAPSDASEVIAILSKGGGVKGEEPPPIKPAAPSFASAFQIQNPCNRTPPRRLPAIAADERRGDSPIPCTPPSEAMEGQGEEGREALSSTAPSEKGSESMGRRRKSHACRLSRRPSEQSAAGETTAPSPAPLSRPISRLASTESISTPKRMYVVRRESEELSERLYRFHFEGKGGKYWKQGDARLESEQANRERQNLMGSRRIWRACRQFWDAVGLREGDVMSKAQYWQLHGLISCVLAPGMSEEEAAEAAEEDWLADLRGESEMSFELHLLSIFEVADLWTNSTEELDYVIFINKLFRRCTYPVQNPPTPPMVMRRFSRGRRDSRRSRVGSEGGSDSEEGETTSVNATPTVRALSPVDGSPSVKSFSIADSPTVYSLPPVDGSLPMHGSTPRVPGGGVDPGGTEELLGGDEPRVMEPPSPERLSEARECWAIEQEAKRKAKALAFREAWRARGGALSSESDGDEGEGGSKGAAKPARKCDAHVWGSEQGTGKTYCDENLPSIRSLKSLHEMREEADVWAIQHKAAVEEARVRAQQIVAVSEDSESADAVMQSPVMKFVADALPGEHAGHERTPDDGMGTGAGVQANGQGLNREGSWVMRGASEEEGVRPLDGGKVGGSAGEAVLIIQTADTLKPLASEATPRRLETGAERAQSEHTKSEESMEEKERARTTDAVPIEIPLLEQRKPIWTADELTKANHKSSAFEAVAKKRRVAVETVEEDKEISTQAAAEQEIPVHAVVKMEQIPVEAEVKMEIPMETRVKEEIPTETATRRKEVPVYGVDLPVEEVVANNGFSIAAPMGMQETSMEAVMGKQHIPAKSSKNEQEILIDAVVGNEEILVESLREEQGIPVLTVEEEEKRVPEEAVLKHAISVEALVGMEKVPVQAVEVPLDALEIPLQAGKIELPADAPMAMQETSVEAVVGKQQMPVESLKEQKRIKVEAVVGKQEIAMEVVDRRQEIPVQAVEEKQEVPEEAKLKQELPVHALVGAEEVVVQALVNGEQIPVDAVQVPVEDVVRMEQLLVENDLKKQEESAEVLVAPNEIPVQAVKERQEVPEEAVLKQKLPAHAVVGMEIPLETAVQMQTIPVEIALRKQQVIPVEAVAGKQEIPEEDSARREDIQATMAEKDRVVLGAVAGKEETSVEAVEIPVDSMVRNEETSVEDVMGTADIPAQLNVGKEAPAKSEGQAEDSKARKKVATFLLRRETEACTSAEAEPQGPRDGAILKKSVLSKARTKKDRSSPHTDARQDEAIDTSEATAELRISQQMVGATEVVGEDTGSITSSARESRHGLGLRDARAASHENGLADATLLFTVAPVVSGQCEVVVGTAGEVGENSVGMESGAELRDCVQPKPEAESLLPLKRESKDGMGQSWDHQAGDERWEDGALRPLGRHAHTRASCEKVKSLTESQGMSRRQTGIKGDHIQAKSTSAAVSRAVWRADAAVSGATKMQAVGTANQVEVEARVSGMSEIMQVKQEGEARANAIVKAREEAEARARSIAKARDDAEAAARVRHASIKAGALGYRTAVGMAALQPDSRPLAPPLMPSSAHKLASPRSSTLLATSVALPDVNVEHPTSLLSERRGTPGSSCLARPLCCPNLPGHPPATCLEVSENERPSSGSENQRPSSGLVSQLIPPSSSSTQQIEQEKPMVDSRRACPSEEDEVNRICLTYERIPTPTSSAYSLGHQSPLVELWPPVAPEGRSASRISSPLVGASCDIQRLQQRTEVFVTPAESSHYAEVGVRSRTLTQSAAAKRSIPPTQRSSHRIEQKLLRSSQVIEPLPPRQQLRRPVPNLAQRRDAAALGQQNSTQNMVASTKCRVHCANIEVDARPSCGQRRNASRVMPLGDVTHSGAGVDLHALPAPLEQQGWRRKRLGEALLSTNVGWR